MALTNQKIAQAKPEAKANAAYINALFVEGYNRKATDAELKKFVGMTVKDSANTILGSFLSPFANKRPSLIWPLKKVKITQYFGERPEVYRQFGMKGHDGLDLKTRYIDSPFGVMNCMSCTDGIVTEVRWNKTGYGTHVRIHTQGLGLMIYGHLSKALVSKGQIVKQGQVIGKTGNTGFSSAPHLHLELRPDPLNSGNGYGGAVNLLNHLPKYD